MQHHVIVSFGKEKEFEFKFSAVDQSTSAVEEARHWFNREFEALECDVATPTGKVLVVDRILSVARYAGEERFAQRGTWADQFVKYTATVLGRDLIRVDVPNYAIGY